MGTESIGFLLEDAGVIPPATRAAMDEAPGAGETSQIRVHPGGYWNVQQGLASGLRN